MPRKRKSIIPKLPYWLQVCLITGGAIIILLFLIIVEFHLFFRQRIYPGVKVANIDLGGRNLVQTEELLQQATLGRENILKLNYQEQNWEINLENLGLRYLPLDSARKAYLTGRTGNFKKDVLDKKDGLRGKVNLDFDYQINQSLLEAVIASISGQIDIPSIPPSIQLIKDEQGRSKISIQSGQPGKELKQIKLKETINHQLAKLLKLNISLPVEQLLPTIAEKQVETTKTRAEKLLGKKLVLSFEKNSWELNEAELINFLAFTNSFDQEKIASFSSQLAQSVDRPAENALFNFQNGKVIEFMPAKNGQALNQEKTKLLFGQGLENLEKGQEKILTIDLPVILTKPKIGTENVNNLGIKELIGQGESWFWGSISSRIHNIKLASSQINGLLVTPGQTFSLNEALGDVSAQTGYQQAWVIREGRTVLGDGGGVCQVSTTLFRAALNAGLPIEERQAHAYRVGYYEQKYQVGVDATVFAPSPDFKFKNDTPQHILIQTKVDTANVKLTYSLYGTSDGRIATVSQTRIWDQNPPPPDLYQDDPTLPAGVVKQIDWSAWGAKTAFDWRVVRGETVLQERTFYSYYKPWQAIFLRGTGGQ